MKNNIIHYVYIVLLFLTVTTHAQVFPVTATAQLVPPYSLNLSDYGVSSSDKIFLNIFLGDVTEERQVTLKLYIENRAKGLFIQTNDNISAPPISIQGGIPLRLSNIDLRPYFQLNNLQGITPDQYRSPLPEGLYQFCFEVYDFISGKKISRKSCTSVYLVLNNPPLLNLPQNGEQLVVKNPQNIYFTWTPRHLNATNVTYEFTLIELWDNTADPQNIFLASQPLFQTTTRATSLVYGPGETQLLPNKRYGWRVKAYIDDGVSKTSVFKNSGYSEIYHFTYTNTCNPPEYILARSAGSDRENITWQAESLSSNNKEYRVQYRKKDSKNTWFEGTTNMQSTTIYGLEPGMTYEYRVGARCIENGPFIYSDVQEFTLVNSVVVDENDSSYNCGIAPKKVKIVNNTPLKSLNTNKTFTAGDFIVNLQEVNGGDGVFSGSGYITVPYMRDAKIKVHFNNVKINSEYQLLEGVIHTNGKSNY